MKLVTTVSLGELAKTINCEVQGDAQAEVMSIASVEQASSGQISFLVNPYYKKFLASTQATAVILTATDAKECSTNCLVTSNPRLSLAKLLALTENYQQPVNSGIHESVVLGVDTSVDPTATIGPNCVIGNKVTIAAGVVIGAGSVIGNDCIIGANSEIKPNVTFYDRVYLGANVIVHSSTVVGSDGFGYAQDNNTWVKMPHLGGVEIGDNVEIGSGTTIDRGVLENTHIESGAIIDNLVQIGHNVQIGKNTAIAGCVGIAGSTKIGAQCLLGGGAKVAGHLDICNGVIITATTSVNRSITKSGMYSSGIPAKENSIWRKNVARFQFLDNLAKKVKTLENTVKKLTQGQEIST